MAFRPRAFDPQADVGTVIAARGYTRGFDGMAAEHPEGAVSADVVVLAGPPPRLRPVAGPYDTLPAGPLALVGAGMGAFALLTLVGLGWARAAAPVGGPRGRGGDRPGRGPGGAGGGGIGGRRRRRPAHAGIGDDGHGADGGHRVGGRGSQAPRGVTADARGWRRAYDPLVLIDRYLPEFDVHERHHALVEAPPDANVRGGSTAGSVQVEDGPAAPEGPGAPRDAPPPPAITRLDPDARRPRSRRVRHPGGGAGQGDRPRPHRKVLVDEGRDPARRARGVRRATARPAWPRPHGTSGWSRSPTSGRW